MDDSVKSKALYICLHLCGVLAEDILLANLFFLVLLQHMVTLNLEKHCGR